MIWEHDFLSAIQSLRSPALDWIMAFFSYINIHGLLSVALAIVLIIFKRTRRTGVQTLMSIALAYIIANLIIKHIVIRPRPYMQYTDLIPLVEKPLDSSFPSGHAANVFAAATAIFLNNKKYGIIAIVFAVVVCFSRLYNLVHYPTDVLAGILIGIGAALLVYYFLYGAAEKGVRKLKSKKA